MPKSKGKQNNSSPIKLQQELVSLAEAHKAPNAQLVLYPIARDNYLNKQSLDYSATNFSNANLTSEETCHKDEGSQQDEDEEAEEEQEYKQQDDDKLEEEAHSDNDNKECLSTRTQQIDSRVNSNNVTTNINNKQNSTRLEVSRVIISSAQNYSNIVLA